jgi:hypothetical protein
MDDDTSQGKMAAANAIGATRWIAAQLPTPAVNSSSQATPSPTSLFHPDSLVTLLVGPEEERMVVHESYLSRDSAFFKAALKKQWTEGQTRVIKLPEELSEPVQYYIGYLYGGQLPTHNQVDGSPYSTDCHQSELLAQLYVLGERVLNAKYQDTIIHEIFRLSKIAYGPEKNTYYPGGIFVNVVYQGTSSQSPARRMVVDFAVCHGGKAWLNEGRDAGFFFDLSKALFQKMMDQVTVRDFRLDSMKVDDYLMSTGT